MVRTDMHCTHCSRPFIAQLSMEIDGNHVIECPYCGHEHCRVVKDGVVSGDRWDTRMQRVEVEKRCVWKSDSRPIYTSTAASFIRDSWLNRSDLNL